MVLVLVDHERGEPDELSLQALTFGRRLAEQLGVALQAVVVGEAAGDIARRLAAYGASTVHVVEHERLDEYAPEAWAESVVQLMAAASAQAVIAAGSDRGNEVLAHVAARADLPLAANCTAVEAGDTFHVTRVRWGGSLLEEAALGGAVKLLTVAPHAVAAEESDAAGELEVVGFTPELSEREFRVRVTGRLEPPAGTVTLQSARVVVGGGRGVGSPEGFAALEELAGLLGGTVGCSRAVTSLGWRSHADQIGQTGVRIAPDLYVACGISGAIQHIVGCKAAKRILVVNTDPQAPILARADYAVVGDVGQVVPALSAEIKQVREAVNRTKEGVDQ
jgi:electron transfer flavoprotein alpha subunit